MKINRHLAAAAGALLLVTSAASVALLGGGTSASAAGSPSSAFGLELTAAGTPAIEQMPSVVSADGSRVTDELVDADALNPLLSGGVVQVAAENGHAMANVTGLGVGDGLLAQLPAEVRTPLRDACAQLVAALEPATGPVNDALVDQLLPGLDSALNQIGGSTADSPLDLSLLGGLDVTRLTNLQLGGLCDVLAGQEQLIGLGTVIAECNGDSGNVTVENGTVLGLPVNIPVARDSRVVIPQVATIVANEQIPNADGTFTVNALHITLLGQIDLTIASATCGEVTADRPRTPRDAPAPASVEAELPVTG